MAYHTLQSFDINIMDHKLDSFEATDRPFEVGPNSVAFLLRFPLPQMGMPYIFGKFRAQRKCPISNIFEQMNF